MNEVRPSSEWRGGVNGTSDRDTVSKSMIALVELRVMASEEKDSE